jgi:hypothetical protein
MGKTESIEAMTSQQKKKKNVKAVFSQVMLRFLTPER